MRWSDLILHYLDRYRWGVFALLAVTYLLGFNGQWRPEPDAALYLELGRNLAEGNGYTYHGEAHRLAYPGWPWVLAGLFRVFGAHAVFAAHVVVFLMGVACLFLMYRLMRTHGGRPFAVLMTLGLGASRTFNRYCFELRSDMPFLLGVMAVLAGYEGIMSRHEQRSGSEPSTRPGLDWSLLIGGLLLAVVTRPTMWALLLALGLAVAWQGVRGRINKKALIVLAMLPAAAAVFLIADPRRHGGGTSTLGDYEDVLLQSVSSQSLKLNLHTLLEPMAGEALFGLDFGQSVRFGGFSVNAIFSVIALAVGFSLFRRRAFWGLWFSITVVMMIFVLARDRYFLPVLPILICAWWAFIRWVNLRIPNRRWANAAFVLLFIVGAVPNGAKVGELFIEQRHRPMLAEFRKGRFESSQRVGQMIATHVPKDGWVIAPRKFGRILTFLSRRNVVEQSEMPKIEHHPGKIFILKPLEPIEDDLSRRIGPAVATVQGKYDKQPWTLHRVDNRGAEKRISRRSTQMNADGSKQKEFSFVFIYVHLRLSAANPLLLPSWRFAFPEALR